MGVWCLAGFLQFLGSGESFSRGEGTAKSKGEMEGALLTGQKLKPKCQNKGNFGPKAGSGIQYPNCKVVRTF